MDTKINFYSKTSNGFYGLLLTIIMVISLSNTSNAQTCSPPCDPPYIAVYNCTNCTLRIVLHSSCGTDYTNTISIPPGGPNCQTVAIYSINRCTCIDACCDCADGFELYSDPNHTFINFDPSTPGVIEDFPNSPTPFTDNSCQPCNGTGLRVTSGGGIIKFECY
ncbi:MAG: hypothetical protein NTX03_02085 [Bacteroidetes bacterium]|nr:hypothetical protein [Bacteroidota bacterium]